MRSDQIPANVLSGDRRLIVPKGENFEIVGGGSLAYLKVDVRGVAKNAIDCRGAGFQIDQIELEISDADGIKLHNGSCNDLRFGKLGVPSYIRCHPSTSTVHTDGIQAMHGSRVRLLSVVISLMADRGNAGALLGRGTSNWPAPNEVTLEGCYVGDGGSKPVTIAESSKCGVINCHGWKSVMWGIGLNVTAKAVNPVVQNWVEHPAGSFDFEAALDAVDEGGSTPPPEPPPVPPPGDCQAQLDATKAELAKERQVSAGLASTVSNLRDGIDDLEAFAVNLSKA